MGRGDRGSLADPLVNDSGGGRAPNGGSRGDSWSPGARWEGPGVGRGGRFSVSQSARPWEYGDRERNVSPRATHAPRPAPGRTAASTRRAAGRSGRSETSQSLPGFCIGAGVQPGDALTAGAAGGLAGRAGRHHVATLPPAVLPRHLMLMLMASRCCGGRRAAPSYVRAAAGASAEGTGLPQGHIPFPGQPPSDDSLKEKYQSPPT